MKKSLFVIFLTVLVFVISALAVPRQAAARQVISTPLPAGVRLLAVTADATSSLRLLVAETAPDSQHSILYLVQPADPAQKQPLAEVTHRTGYPPGGQVSPDGRQVALLVIPPGVTEASARTDGGELWLAAVDGSAVQRVTGGVGSLAGWSADGKWLAYTRLAAIPNPPNSQIPYRTEIYKVQADKLPVSDPPGSLIFTDAQNYGVHPLGWLADGSYLTALLDMNGVWRLAASTGGTPMRTWSLPAVDLVRQLSLSPLGDQVLIEAVNDGQDELVVFDLASGLLQAQPPLAAAPIPASLPVSPVQGAWSARGHLWILHQSQSGGPLRSEINGASLPTARPEISLGTNEYLLAESWSPDENWFLYRHYPHNYNSAYLQQRSSSSLSALQPDQPGNWLTFFGWIPAGDSK